MNIGIVGYFNPYEVKEYFPQNIEVPSINIAASSVNATIRGFLQEGHYVRVFTSHSYKGKPLHIKGNQIDVHIVPEKSFIIGANYIKRIYMVNRLKREIKKNIKGIDVLHAQWTYEFALAAKHFSNIMPIFCTVRDWCPYIYSITHGIKEKLYWKISMYIFKAVMKGNDIHFIANSEYTFNQIKTLYPEKKIIIIPNPIIKEKIIQSKISESKDQVFISIAQSLDDPRKNIHRLLQAFKEYHDKNTDSNLILIGMYSTQSYNHWKASGLLNNVLLTGTLSKNECFEQLDKSTVLIHPSIEETFGNTLLEGMARCLPCIGGYKSGAVPKVLGYGKYGILCDVNDVNSIVSAMCKTEDKKYIKELTHKCTLYLIQEYQNNIIAQRHVELYKKYL